MKDITEFARKLVAMVARLAMRGRNFEKNFTVNHMVDILRGSQNKKVKDSKWDTDPAYASGKAYSPSDLSRIIRKLVLDKYLWEELAVSTEGVVSAYVKPGPKAQNGQIKTDKITINIEGKSNVKVASTNSNGSLNDASADNVLKTLEEECFTELKNAISQNFPDLKSVYLALPIECFRAIAEKLPVTKAEMIEIEQMTHFRYERFGPHLLEVCKEFNAKRMNYLEDKQLAEMMAKEEEANVFNAPSSNNPIYQNDTQRRSGWMGKSVNIGSSRGSGFKGRGRGGRGRGGRGNYYKKGFSNKGRGKKRGASSDFSSPNTSWGGNSSTPTSSAKSAPAPKKPVASSAPSVGLMGPPRTKAPTKPSFISAKSKF